MNTSQLNTNGTITQAAGVNAGMLADPSVFFKNVKVAPEYQEFFSAIERSYSEIITAVRNLNIAGSTDAAWMLECGRTDLINGLLWIEKSLTLIQGKASH